MHYQLRLGIPAPIKNCLRKLSHYWLFSDLESVRTYRRLLEANGSSGLHSPESQLKVRSLPNSSITIRSGSSDAAVVYSTFFHRFHLPPRRAVPRHAKLIFDLGANIGTTMAHLAFLYPNARIFGVEMDEANSDLCKRNIEQWRDRCRVIQGAVWFEDGELVYDVGVDAQCYTATSGLAEPSRMIRKVKARSMSSLLNEFAQDEAIDYVKIDIEGAERQVLRKNADWLRRVRCIKIELHDDYHPDDCIRDLRPPVSWLREMPHITLPSSAFAPPRRRDA